jgi:hypothetical protein
VHGDPPWLENVRSLVERVVDVAIYPDSDFVVDLDVHVDRDRLVGRFHLHGGAATADDEARKRKHDRGQGVSTQSFHVVPYWLVEVTALNRPDCV